ncbi:MAG: ribosomal subunit interface protein [Planctomycetales bacterium 12-60-4]|nr:MAG: ribosomal subunit interface protein [Planctomycetales bacterium 12-60-4]
MQVAIACRHGSLHAETREHVTQKAEKLLTYFDRITAIQVTFDFSNGEATAEILVDAEHKHNFVASEKAAEAGFAFDAALVKMEQQLRKYKEKIQNHRGGPTASDIAGEAPVDAGEVATDK